MPERIYLRWANGWRMPEGAVKVDRPTRWGNPFAIGARLIPNRRSAFFARGFMSHDNTGDIHQPESFPISIVVFCDGCGTEVQGDYLVHDLMTHEQRLSVGRSHLSRNEGWSCTSDGDFCPECKSAEREDPKTRPSLPTGERNERYNQDRVD